MSTSKIEWTDRTWNPVRGCTKISPGCKNCYAETFAERWRGVPGHPYEQGFDLRLVPEKLDEPLHWKKPCRIFVNSMSDLFQEGVPFEFIDKVFAVMALCPQHTFQILTKRPERMQEYFAHPTELRERWYDMLFDPGVFPGDPRRAILGQPSRAGVAEGILKGWRPVVLLNVHLGVSVEDQKNKIRIDLLRDTPAAVRFLSIEPILEDIGKLDLRGIHWVIIGSESGNKARDYETVWFESIIRQCEEAGVACFVKQITFKGRKIPFEKWLGYLQVRQFPEVSRWRTMRLGRISKTTTIALSTIKAMKGERK